MKGFIDYFDKSKTWMRVLLAVLGVPGFLYRLFNVIIDKAKDTKKLVYLILNVVPIVSLIIYIVDIVWCALKRPLPLSFSDWSSKDENAESANEADAQEAEVKDDK